MNKILLLACMATLAFTSCSKTQQTTDNSEQTTSNDCYTVESLLASADKLVNDTITVKGTVTHTCKHSGRRCFIVGEDTRLSIRVEAKGEIGGFNRELIGSDIIVKGIVKEHRLTYEYINQVEENLNAKMQGEDGSSESCESEMSNIAHMKQWMKENNKDYYANYFIYGLNYEPVE